MVWDAWPVQTLLLHAPWKYSQDYINVNAPTLNSMYWEEWSKDMVWDAQAVQTRLIHASWQNPQGYRNANAPIVCMEKKMKLGSGWTRLQSILFQRTHLDIWFKALSYLQK